jgi:hypothetical protein
MNASVGRWHSGKKLSNKINGLGTYSEGLFDSEKANK